MAKAQRKSVGARAGASAIGAARSVKAKPSPRAKPPKAPRAASPSRAGPAAEASGVARAAPAKTTPMPPEILAYHGAQAPGDRRICEALASAIDRHLHDSERKVWHRHPVWFLEGNPIVGYSKLKGCVRLLFWSGQSFDEAGLAPEGSFKAAEARFTHVDQVSAIDLERWLSKAREIQWDYKNIVKRRGRLERLK